MSDNLELYDDKIRSIESIEFNIWGNEEIRRVSALGKDNYGIEIPDLYDNMEPKRGGLIDTRLGVTSNSLECSTCGFDSKNCIGHFGHIELHDYMFHYGYLQFLKKILSCICLKCSKLLISKNDDEILELLKNKTGKARFVEVHKTIKNVTYCAKPGYGCGTPVTKIKIEPKKALCTTLLTSELHVMENDEEGVAQDDTADSAPTFKKDDFKKKIIRQVLTPEICYDILKNISDSDCMILGIDPSKSRPEYMIHKIFPVSPVAIRPSAKVDFLES
jgi:DNA-directed RNA polymerase II subunit RPB1